jgi:hypothetical protein
MPWGVVRRAVRARVEESSCSSSNENWDEAIKRQREARGLNMGTSRVVFFFPVGKEDGTARYWMSEIRYPLSRRGVSGLESATFRELR